jgi:hypothetical protein
LKVVCELVVSRVCDEGLCADDISSDRLGVVGRMLGAKELDGIPDKEEDVTVLKDSRLDSEEGGSALEDLVVLSDSLEVDNSEAEVVGDEASLTTGGLGVSIFDD